VSEPFDPSVQLSYDFGEAQVKKIPFLVPEPAEIVYCHHEHFDGSGYPRELKGDQIPLGARIVADANALDSMTSDLPWRPRDTYLAAREEIRACSGRQFDPQIAKAFLEMLDKIWEDLRRDIEARRHSP